jgi:hypothetical protein
VRCPSGRFRTSHDRAMKVMPSPKVEMEEPIHRRRKLAWRSTLAYCLMGSCRRGCEHWRFAIRDAGR